MHVDNVHRYVHVHMKMYMKPAASADCIVPLRTLYISTTAPVVEQLVPGSARYSSPKSCYAVSVV